MASLQIIKRRIKSVKSTRQITKAMQLVAASKLRRAQTAATAPQAYTAAARQLLLSLSGQTATVGHPLFAVRPVKRALTIFIAGDRGMAGRYNANIIRALVRHMKDIPANHAAIAVGKRAAMHVARAKDVDQIAAYEVETGNASSDIALPILSEVIRQFQDSYFNSCYQSTVWGYDTPNFVKVALAYGIDSYSINKAQEIEKGLSMLWKNPSQPFLLEVSLDIQTNVYPKTMFGSPLTRMESE